jgi:hypothetical protein
MKHLLLPALALAVLACSPPQSGTEEPDAAAVPSVAFAANTGTIFAGEKALELVEPCSRPPPAPLEGTWTPSESEIAAMEPALARYLAQNLRGAWPDSDHIAVEDYRRQYGGLILGGQRIIYVNGFRLTEYDDQDTWRSFPHVICDGGPIMFGVEYDPATQSFRNFAFNGAV